MSANVLATWSLLPLDRVTNETFLPSEIVICCVLCAHMRPSHNVVLVGRRLCRSIDKVNANRAGTSLSFNFPKDQSVFFMLLRAVLRFPFVASVCILRVASLFVLFRLFDLSLRCVLWLSTRACFQGPSSSDRRDHTCNQEIGMLLVLTMEGVLFRVGWETFDDDTTQEHTTLNDTLVA